MSIEKRELQLFVACLPGLEPMLAGELGGLGASGIEPDAGGVACRGALETMYRINLCSGLATHVLVRIASFHARRLPELRRKADHVAWGEWLLDRGAGGPVVTVRAVCRKSKLYHTGAVEQRIGEAIRAALGIEVASDHAPGAAPGAAPGTVPGTVPGTAPGTVPGTAPGTVPGTAAGDAAGAGTAAVLSPPHVAVRLSGDWCTISLDSSGEPLHRRGWRLEAAKAPLREDLAHALLCRSGWRHDTPLVDPMMGSGTLLIEGAALARRLPPGRLRSFGWLGTRLDDAAIWRAVRAAALARSLDRAPARILGSDRDAGAVAAARRNAERAGVAADLELGAAALRDAPGLALGATLGAGTVVTNPPYGRRIGEGDRLVPLYQALGRLLTALPPAWNVALCAADRRLALRTGLPLRTGFLTAHGGLKVRALCRRGSGFAEAGSAAKATTGELQRDGHAESPPPRS